MHAPFVTFPEPAVGVYHPVIPCLHPSDPFFEGRHPVLKTVRALSWRVQVKIVEASGEEVYYLPSRSVGRVELVKLLVDDSIASQAL